MAYAEVRGLNMYYEVEGDGPPLVLIMGLSANTEWWDPEEVATFGRHFRLLMFDNRDAGRTTGPPEPRPYSIKDMADDTAALMDHVGISRAHVMGMSMGGMIAQELVLNYPDRVDRLILGCTSPGQSMGVPPGPEVMAQLLESREGMSLAEVAQRLVKVLFSPEWVADNQEQLAVALERLGSHPISQQGYQRQLMAISMFDAGPRLGEIKAPTLVLHGTKDILVPPKNGEILAERIPGARLDLFDGAAHGFKTEQPERFREAVVDFLEGRDA